MTSTSAPIDDADVIVVGAGPGGSTAGYYLARAGLNALVLEKASFPRDKICGDGLTPRAVSELVSMGVDITGDGWMKNRGLRVHGGGHTIEVPWPTMASYPDFGLVRPRKDFDALLANHARQAGARVQERTNVTGPILHERTGRVVGVQARLLDENGRRTGEEVEYRAPLVIAADGVSARMALALGIEKRDNRPMGVAVRTYFKTPLHDEEWMESHLELWDGERGNSNLLPGYGWVFPAGDGTANVGLGSVSSTATATKLDYRDLFKRWIAHTPEEWGFTEENQVGPVRGAALPMAFNRKPLYRKGMMLIGDAGGMVSPFNGEGIAYAMKAARTAAEIAAQSLVRPDAYQREKTLRRYPEIMAQELGGYFNLGRVFVRIIEHPEAMRFLTRYGLPRPTLMKLTMKLLADSYESHGGDSFDRLIAGLARIAPKS